MTQGERVKELRSSLNLTLEKFGERLGVGKGAISAIETGKRNLTKQMCLAISRVYKVDYLWLSTGEGEPFPKSDDEDIMTQLEIIMAGESDTHKNLIKSLVTCSEEELQTIEKFIDIIKKRS